jgi:hypothetical protein
MSHLHLRFQSLGCFCVCFISAVEAYVAYVFQKLMLHLCFNSYYVASVFQKLMLHLCFESLCCICVSKAYVTSVFQKLVCFKSLCCSYGGGYDLAARRKNATRESTATLKAWLNEHKKNPYPTKGEKIMLAIITKMTLTQVCTVHYRVNILLNYISLI